ncbi:hypothetical protein PRK78_000269 [Emydomyces testavorans]|uniref:Putative 5'-nucleotidase C-terminal domain-containing protein n=1 Tax=Emydomyces testavorans TaxID=2070801 RepID=A0AAF0DAT3_9EURO|nr:hypothetical protein PRK78_000269 [Emydomyces testavorans]
MLLSTIFFLAVQISGVIACSDCYGPSQPGQHERLVRRMQPEALNATTSPRGPLEWGQINFLQTTDTHGWLAGHLKERNYGADWGDFVSFVKHMRQKADRLHVDLLVVDTGDLHDGNGLSDVTTPDGLISDAIFSEIDYDLLAIGNHELYVTEVAYQSYANISKPFGERYLTSNVQLLNRETGQFQDFGSKYRYFITKHGLRIMAFGVLFDFTGNSNVSRVTKAEDMVKESWFKNAVNSRRPIDLFVVIGHNAVRPTASSSTFGTVYKAIRAMRPDIPIQTFGGHTHVRDFVVYDEMSTGLEAGRYCETLGWLSLTGIKSPTFIGSMHPRGVPNPVKKAVKPRTQEQDPSIDRKRSSLTYARRYLDWNRLTFAYHAPKSQDGTFDTPHGLEVTGDITKSLKGLNLTYIFGCAPKTYCQSCKPFGAEGSIYKLVQTALATTVVNPSRADTPRLILINSGTIRFDLVQGPFTVGDSYIVSPFENAFQFIPDVPYSVASKVLGVLNNGPWQKRYVETYPVPSWTGEDVCVDPPYTAMQGRSEGHQSNSFTRREMAPPIIYPGYTTVDDFGTDGDDTPHSKLPYFRSENDVQANASFPTDGSMPKTVDVVFSDFIGVKYVLPALMKSGGNYTAADIQLYLPKTFTSHSVLPAYAMKAWQENVPNCPVGEGVQ